MTDHAATARQHERAFLAAVILDGKQLRAERDGIGVGDFLSAKHAEIWRAMVTLDEAGDPVDKATVSAELESTGKIAAAGGHAYLTSLLDDTGQSGQAAWYANRIRQHAARRAVGTVGERLTMRSGNGVTDEQLVKVVADEMRQLFGIEAALRGGRKIIPVDLYSPEIVPTRPEFAVTNLIRRSGLHLVWAEPSGGKTWTLLRWMHELLFDTGCGRLCGHPDLWINRRFERVVWIATEEDGPTLRYKAEQIRRGLDLTEADARGKIDYVFAADSRRRVTLDDLPSILDAQPYSAAILDSLTGLRPKTINGERIRWDVDNDAANELCLRLRGIATDRRLGVFPIHHTGRDTSRGYRGPTDWWASADVMLGFIPEAGRTKVVIEKNRDGRRLAPFYLTPTWEGEREHATYTLAFDGSATPAKLTPTAEKVLAWFKGVGQASQAQAVAAKLGGRTTIQEVIRTLVGGGLLRNTSNNISGSPIYAWVPEGAGTETGTSDREK